MKEIHSYFGLKEELSNPKDSWLLLYKKGAEQSECAFVNYGEATAQLVEGSFLFADTNLVRDIHAELNVTSVPALVRFKDGKVAAIFKGCQKPEYYSALFHNKVFLPKGTGKEAPARAITVYTTPSCSWCKTLKRHLDANGIRYREIDVASDQMAAKEMVRKSGQQGVPQTDINGQMVVGFDRTKINSLLGIN